MKITQTERLLKALKNAGPNGLHPTFFIQDLHIYQYSARIHEIREQFHCECKHGKACLAQEHIKNKDLHNGTTKFWYVDEREGYRQRMKHYQEEDEAKMCEDQVDSLF